MDVTATVETLTSGSLTIPYMTMTERAIPCSAPVLYDNFDACGIPGGVDLWSRDGFYSPGQCFSGYAAMCTQLDPVWPLGEGETAVRCIPEGYNCNSQGADQKYAVTSYNELTLSAPAFEIRWRSEDVKTLPEPESSTTVTFVKHGRPTIATATSSMTMETTTFQTVAAASSSSQSDTSQSSSEMRSQTSSSSTGETGEGPDSTPSPSPTASPSAERTNATPSLTTVAGIVAGTLLGIVGAALLIAYVVYRRRRARRDATKGWPEGSTGAGPLVHHPDPAGQSWGGWRRGPAELDEIRHNPGELAATPSRHTMGVQNVPIVQHNQGCACLDMAPVELEGPFPSGGHGHPGEKQAGSSQRVTLLQPAAAMTPSDRPPQDQDGKAEP